MAVAPSSAQFRIAEGSESYSRALFEYPVGVVLKPTGKTSQSANGFDYEGLELVEGSVRLTDGKVATDFRYRPRHVEGSIRSGDSIVLYAEIDGRWTNVGWFAVSPVEAS
jgi:hypothetical protein